MRNKLLISGASTMLTILLAGVIVATTFQDAYEDRISDLETRVARLEAVVGIPATPTASAGQDGQDGEDGEPGTGQDGQDGEPGAIINIPGSSSSSSSSSSSQQGSHVFTATYSGSGDRVISLEIDHLGVYQVTVDAPADSRIRLESQQGETIPAFALAGQAGDPVTATAELEAEDYSLTVEASAPWSIVITSTGR